MLEVESIMPHLGYRFVRSTDFKMPFRFEVFSLHE